MALSLRERKFEYFDQQYPTPATAVDGNTHPDYHLIALLIIFSLDTEVRKATFPLGSLKVDMTLLLQHYGEFLDPEVCGEKAVQDLSGFAGAFREVKNAWSAFGPYHPDPCPTRKAIRALVVATQSLPDSKMVVP